MRWLQDDIPWEMAPADSLWSFWSRIGPAECWRHPHPGPQEMWIHTKNTKGTQCLSDQKIAWGKRWALTPPRQIRLASNSGLHLESNILARLVQHCPGQLCPRHLPSHAAPSQVLIRCKVQPGHPAELWLLRPCPHQHFWSILHTHSTEETEGRSRRTRCLAQRRSAFHPDPPWTSQPGYYRSKLQTSSWLM